MPSGGKNLKEVNPEEIDKLVRKPTFFNQPTTSTGKEFFYFRKIGDSIEGYLGRSIDNSTINRTKSFVIDTINGLEEFFANRLLQRFLNKLDGKYVKVVYIGDQKTQFGHRRKVYRVFAEAGSTWNQSVKYIGETEKPIPQNQKELEKDGSRKQRKRTSGSTVGAG